MSGLIRAGMYGGAGRALGNGLVAAALGATCVVLGGANVPPVLG